jgi:SAM-dependent methyltransferase
VARYFHDHAVDFDTIYAEKKPVLRRLRDRLTRGTVVKRLEYVDGIAARRQPSRVVDVGCGSGRFATRLAGRGATVVGLDFAAEMVALAERAAVEAGVDDRCTFLGDDFLTWECGDSFDLALAIGVFDYVSEPDPLLAKLGAVSGGSVIASFPRRLHPLVPLRLARLRAEGCPVYFYGRRQVEELGQRHLDRFEVISFSRDYLLVGNP